MCLLAVVLLSGCGVQKTAMSERTGQEEHLEERRTSVQDSTESEWTHRTLKGNSRVQIRTELTMEAVPESVASMELTEESLHNLPEGAEYSTSSGRSSLTVRRISGGITVTSRCDSIARLCRYYEERLDRSETEIDSLHNILSARSTDSTAVISESSSDTETVQATETRLRSGWFGWLASGFMAGVLVMIFARIIIRKLIS